ncbi:MAG: UvrD-helicase domain-containing protein [Actinobacteria bacterium]|nr:UvrD-helicase domain-containing protein [Actinomycetota bacterium]
MGKQERQSRVEALCRAEQSKRSGSAVIDDATDLGVQEGEPGQSDHSGHSGQSDQFDRDAISTDLDRILFVDAGAGTGKTTALVGRILGLIVSGRAEITQVAAITFTDAAASELKDRLSEELERVARLLDSSAERGGERPETREYVWGDATPTGPSGPEERSPVEPSLRHLRRESRDHLWRALEDVDSASISTFHGFARKVLQDNSFAAGLPPTFDVTDAIDSGVKFDEQWSVFIDRLLDDESYRDALLQADACGFSVEGFRKVTRQIYENWDPSAIYANDLDRVDPLRPIDFSAVTTLLDKAIEFSSFCTEPEDKLLTHIESLKEVVDYLRNEVSPYERLEFLVNAKKVCKKVGRQENWSGKKDDLIELLEVIDERIDVVVSRAADEALVKLLNATFKFANSAHLKRVSDADLSYHDLLVLTRDLLRGNPEVRETVSSRHRYLLIDEYQDTDPIQIEIAMLIAFSQTELSPDDRTGTVHFPQRGVEGGRIFFVGDPKQSIYRFRRADFETYMRVRDHFSDSVVSLRRNYRSVPGVLEWINSVFAEFFGDGVPERQPPYESLLAHRAAPARFSRPPVVLLGGPAAPKIKVDVVRRDEARDIAESIRRARSERWPVGEDGRAARFSDIAVLIPDRNSLPVLVRELDDKDIPYRLESSSLVYSTTEIRELMLVMAAICDPSDQVSVLGALRSSVLGCGDDDLVEYRMNGGSWDYRDAVPDSLDMSQPVVECQRTLKELHEERLWTSVSSLLSRVIVTRKVFIQALAGSRHRDVWRRLRFVLEQARVFEATGGNDLHRYLRWVHQQTIEGSRAVEIVLPEDDHDAVRIMTIHGAKGLEFPIVAVSGAGSMGSSRQRPSVLFGPNGPEAYVSKNLCTTGFNELREDELEIDDCEKTRLLYVAVTRARDHLIVSAHRTSGKEGSHISRIEKLCESCPELWSRLEEGSDGSHDHNSKTRVRRDIADTHSARDDDDVRREVSESDPETSVVSPDVDSIETRDRWKEDRRSRLDMSSRGRAISATSLAELHKRMSSALNGDTNGDTNGGTNGSTDEDVDALGGRRRRTRGRAGTAVGRAVHAVLQCVDLESGEGLEALARGFARSERVSSQESQVKALVQAALNSRAVREAVAGGTYWREMYVGAPVGDVLLEGIVDLLFEGPNGLEIVDYKTDRAGGDEELDEASERYRLQGGAYAVAIEQCLNREVDRCTFLFLRTDGSVERQIEDLGAARDEVRSLLARI